MTGGRMNLNPVSEDAELVPVGELRPGLRNLSMVFIVLDISKPKNVKEDVVRLIKVADKTGSVNMSLWGEKGELLESGDVIRVNKAFTQIFRDSLRLCISKERQLYKIDEFCFHFSEEPNMSEKDLGDFIYPELPSTTVPKPLLFEASSSSGAKGESGVEKDQDGGTKVPEVWSPSMMSPAKPKDYQKQDPDHAEVRKRQEDRDPDGQERGREGQVRRLMLDNSDGFRDEPELKVAYRHQEGRRGIGSGRQGEVRRDVAVQQSQRKQGGSPSGNMKMILAGWLRKNGGGDGDSLQGQDQAQGRNFGNVSQQQRQGGYNKMRHHGGNQDRQDRWGHRHQGRGSHHYPGRGNHLGRGGHHHQHQHPFKFKQTPGKNKPFRCPHCGARFTQKQYYIGHLNNFHKEEQSKEKAKNEKWDSSSSSSD